MKRYISYAFTYILVSVFLLIVVGSIWYMINGGDLSDSVVECKAEVVTVGAPYVYSDTERTSGNYRVSTAQPITVKFDLNGSTYQVSKEVVTDIQDYKQEPNLSEITPVAKYKADTNITIYVSTNNPEEFDISNRFTYEQTSFWDIFKYALPVYLAVVVLFTWSFVQKEKEIKRQAMFDSINR